VALPPCRNWLGLDPAAVTLLIAARARPHFLRRLLDRRSPSSSRSTCCRTLAHCPSQSLQRSSEQPTGAHLEGRTPRNGACRSAPHRRSLPSSTVSFCFAGCTATRRYFTVAAGNCVRVAFLGPGAPRTDPSASGADPKRHRFEIGSLCMRGSADVVLPRPQRRTIAQRREPLIAIIVVGISLGTGYGASRVWPLPISAAPPPSAEMTAFPEPKDALSAQPRLPALSASPAPSQRLAATPDLSQAATITAQSTGGSETLPFSAPVALETPLKRSYRTIEEEASAPAGPTIVRSPHVSRARHARRTSLAGPITPEFAPNPQPNQPSQDFMAYRSRN